MKLGSFTIDFKFQLFLLVFIAIAFNANTLFNEYVLDDAIVISDNQFVAKGIHGIPEIITQSYFKGYKKLENLEFSGGRYRPFALVIFALEYQFFGANPVVSHLINVLLFALLIASLFYLLQKHIFKEQNKNLAFLTCLLFAIHPIHTEVIANVKGRDELITFLLIIVSLITSIRYLERKKIWIYGVSLFCFFLALLTRESAITFVVIAPLILYFFCNQSIKKCLLFSIPLILVVIGYLSLRFIVVDVSPHTTNDISNAPFLYATASEAFATKVFIVFKYLVLLIFPHPLIFEYGYNHIPYVNIISAPFILSSLLLISLLVYSLFTINKKSVYTFSILYFFITIFLVSNFIVDIGTPLSERLLFQPSLAFCIVAAALYFKAEKQFSIPAKSILALLIILFSIKTFSRNAVWKNYETLVLTDVKSAPNSVRINQFAMNIYLSKSIVENNIDRKNEDLKKGAEYGEQMLKICPKIPDIYMNLGYTYYNLFDYNKATELWKQGLKQEPSEQAATQAAEVLSIDLYKLGNGFYERNKTSDAINCYQKSIEINNKNAEAWYNLGGNYFLINDTLKGNDTWQKVLKLSPNHPLNKSEFSKN